MGKLGTKMDYERLRNARILENKARLESLGLHKTLSALRTISSFAKPEKKKYTKVVYDRTALRRSDRLKRLIEDSPSCRRSPLRRSFRLRGKHDEIASPQKGTIVVHRIKDKREGLLSGEVQKRPANAPLVKTGASDLSLTPEVSAQRCNSKGRGSVYDPVFGICCHFCRQKKLCGEEDCKRCGDLDMDEPCLGKTDCSSCHSSNGVLCRACLKVRYGEELDEVRENKEWLCPHCIEEKGINPYWICNSSLCLKKRKMTPTGIAIYRAREMGYESVAHLLMDKLAQRLESKKLALTSNS